MVVRCPKAASVRHSDAQRSEESFLGYLDAADLLHAAFALFLLFEELALAGDVAAVALGRYVLAIGAYGLAGDDAFAHSGLYGDLELLAWDQLLELLDQRATAVVGLVTVDDDRERVHGIAGDEDFDLHEVGRFVAYRLVVVGGVALGAALQSVEEVRDDLGERQVVGELHTPGRDVLHARRDTTLLVAESHYSPDIFPGADHGRPHDGLPDLIEDLGQLARVRNLDNLSIHHDL